MVSTRFSLVLPRVFKPFCVFFWDSKASGKRKGVLCFGFFRRVLGFSVWLRFVFSFFKILIVVLWIFIGFQ